MKKVHLQEQKKDNWFFEKANGGTLFLDEIGDMPIDIQARLLRVLQFGELSRVGGRDIIKTDVRIISATNKNLLTCVENQTFREDLYYRINVINIELPPLRKRENDIIIYQIIFYQNILIIQNKLMTMH